MSAYSDFDHSFHWGTDQEFPFVVRSGVARLALLGTPTGGSFFLTFRGESTAAIAYNAAAAAVQAALLDLPSVKSGEITAAGGALPGTAVTLTFAGDLSGADVSDLTADGTLLTGGTSADAEIIGNPQSIATFTKFWLTGKSDLLLGDAAAEIALTLAGGGIALTDSANGAAKAILTPARYSRLIAGREHTLYVDLRGLDGSGKSHVLASGLWRIQPVATRAVA